METIQYSLNNNISIDIHKIISNDTRDTLNTKPEILRLLNTPPKIKVQDSPSKIKVQDSQQKINTRKFDKYCLDTYGVRTCILFEIDKNKFQIRFLNKNNGDHEEFYIQKDLFYMKIPNLIEDSYTVVVVERIEQLDSEEIVAIHSPGNSV